MMFLIMKVTHWSFSFPLRQDTSLDILFHIFRYSRRSIELEQEIHPIIKLKDFCHLDKLKTKNIK